MKGKHQPRADIIRSGVKDVLAQSRFVGNRLMMEKNKPISVSNCIGA